jgi:tRNA G18 (ribose-2'-O)-methylase SpoU
MLYFFNFRSASAFNFSKVFIISKSEDKKSLKLAKLRKEFGFFGSQGTDKLMDFAAFSTLKEAREFFVANNISVCGVEIGNESKSIVNKPFTGSTVFIMGNEV